MANNGIKLNPIVFKQELLGEFITRDDMCRDCKQIENPQNGDRYANHFCRRYDVPLFHFNRTTGENIHPDLFKCKECFNAR
jgi:hypothetical protein